jgi:hypothetical protein
MAVALLGMALPGAAADMNPHLAPLQAILGKTWRGVLPPSKDGKPTVDVQRWELALNGQVVRVLHSINDGAYGGESLLFWDRDKESLAYYYFTTAGFYTSGTMSYDDGALVSHEVVKGSADGISEVKGITRLLPDGRLHVKTQYLKGGQWVDGRDTDYVEDQAAQVKFK